MNLLQKPSKPKQTSPEMRKTVVFYKKTSLLSSLKIIQFRWLSYFFMLIFIAACKRSPSHHKLPQAEKLENLADTLAWKWGHLYEQLDTESANNWQAVRQETRQSFENYVSTHPTSTTEQRNTIYLQTFGDFTDKEKEVIQLTAEYVSIFYQLPVKILPNQQLDSIPKHATRINRHHKGEQILSTYLLYKVLLPNLPDSAAAYVGFTAEDLYPSQSWNFVFGQANLKKRMGIWSIFRFGQPHKSPEMFDLALERTLKTATHEIGHIFSVKHCVDFECAMAGSNNLRDLDRHPVHFCPICTAKLTHNLRLDLEKRYSELAEFWKQQGKKEYADFYKEHIENK